eukprot:TRINITY_DN10939_c0_g1_i3.p1 TRINITY_DN10939_c0_g1~~TRINITY_DN10939_c0_g1_i3.p1  ORF type:complete len:557 (-),score=96.52 TRINITY_DN10939_c0_g1_i3:123-1793(-)
MEAIDAADGEIQLQKRSMDETLSASLAKKARCESPAAPSRGRRVQFFHGVSNCSPRPSYIQLPGGSALVSDGSRPQLLQSHGWIDGFLEADAIPGEWKDNEPLTWPLVYPQEGAVFVDRHGKQSDHCMQAISVAPWNLREPISDPPALSLVFVRWGGEHAVGSGAEGGGGWGFWGSPPSDTYMAGIVDHGLMCHEELGYESSHPLSFEVFSVFVKDCSDLTRTGQLASQTQKHLRGRKCTVFWMLWPTELDDPEAWMNHNGAPKIITSGLWKSSGDFAGFVGRGALFEAMKAWENAGISTGFPHSSCLYEHIVSKAWLVDLAKEPAAFLPAAVTVNRHAVVADPQQAAEDALAALERVRQEQCATHARDVQQVPFCEKNKFRVVKGVVKLGFSWEGRSVTSFHGKEQLVVCLQQALCREGSLAEVCYVQEWVDSDFEFRLFFMPPLDGSHSTPVSPLRPVHIEYNQCGGLGEEAKPQSACMCSFVSVPASQYLLAQLKAVDSQPVPMMRLDFLVRRLGPGTAQVSFGEYGEVGCCCLKWEDGPPILWRALLDAALL